MERALVLAGFARERFDPLTQIVTCYRAGVECPFTVVRHVGNELLDVTSIVSDGEWRQTSFDGNIFDKTVDHRAFSLRTDKVTNFRPKNKRREGISRQPPALIIICLVILNTFYFLKKVSLNFPIASLPSRIRVLSVNVALYSTTLPLLDLTEKFTILFDTV